MKVLLWLGVILGAVIAVSALLAGGTAVVVIVLEALVGGG